MGLIGDIAGLFAGDNSGQINDLLRNLNPEAGASMYSGIQEDPQLRATQMGTLDALKSIAGGGLRPEDKAAQLEAMDASNRNERGQRGAIMQSMASRGMAGSGNELAAQLANEQGAANRTSMAGTQAAGNASQRALQAIAMRGQMAGNIRGQDFGNAAAKAGAQDAMSKFNAGQRVTKAGMQTGTLWDQGQNDQRRWTQLGNDAGNSLATGFGFL